MGRSFKARVWDRPPIGEKAVAQTSSGSYVIDGTTGMWRRRGTRAEHIEKVLRAEFSRRGFVPRNFKVREIRGEHQKPEEAGAFYLNFGYLRGLDPEEVFRLLNSTTKSKGGKLVRRFPDNCGGRVIMDALTRLEEHVERPPAFMASGLDESDAGPATTRKAAAV